MVVFKFKQKKLEGDLKIKLCGKRLYPTENVKGNPNSQGILN